MPIGTSDRRGAPLKVCEDAICGSVSPVKTHSPKASSLASLSMRREEPQMRHEDIEALLAITLFALGISVTITLANAYVASTP